jgi:hypothetical protein
VSEAGAKGNICLGARAVHCSLMERIYGLGQAIVREQCCCTTVETSVESLPPSLHNVRPTGMRHSVDYAGRVNAFTIQ